ncbi:MAG: hypothetical protein NZ959_09060 [Armatimonadetes bacterium]|nr:hypothetical protein [Armatimonadota bacterium]MDW8123031.1 hypothetical protein [Armatimonadota bacterium]
MRSRPRLWQWIVIVVGLIIIGVAGGRWLYRTVLGKQPPPPATPAEVEKEYREKVLGYP